jgi:hypothetical protein
MVNVRGGIADQGVWSLSNVSLIVITAKRSNLQDVGVMGVVVLVYALLLGMVRSATGLPMLIRFSGSDVEARRAATGAAAGTAALLGLGGTIAFVVVGLLGSDRMQGPMVAVGLLFPLLVVQDVVRHAWLAAHRPWRAARTDLLWLLVCVAGYPIAITQGYGATGLATAWAAGGALSGIAGLVVLRVRLVARQVTGFLRDHWDLTRNHIAENTLQVGSMAVGIAILGFVTNLDDVGQARLGQSLLGPLRTLVTGVALALVPEAVRTVPRGAEPLRHHARLTSVGLVGLSTIFGLALLVIPDGVGELALGDNWDAAQQISLPLSLGMAATAACFGPLVGLRSLQQAGVVVRCASIQVAAAAVGFIVGAFVDGAMGAAFGQAIGVVVTIPPWWRAFDRAIETSPLLGRAVAGAGPDDEVLLIDELGGA